MVSLSEGPPARRATLRDVASLAGVSTATASHALTGKGKISLATRSRIKDAATSLDYRPNHHAASLRRRTTNSIGFVMVPDPDPDSQRRWAGYQAEQLYSLVSHASRRGFTVTMIPEDAPSLVESSRIDALCFLDIRQDVPALLEALRLGLPVLTNDTSDDRFRITVDSGYVAFTLRALDLLADRGARRIGLLTEPLGFHTDGAVERTYVDWCTANLRMPQIARGNHGRTNTAARVNDLLDAGCDAIYSFYEEGPGVLRAILDRGLRVPEDVLVVATVTPNSLSTASAGITSIVFHPERIAPTAFDAFLAVLSDEPHETRRVELPWELLEARSTKD